MDAGDASRNRAAMAHGIGFSGVLAQRISIQTYVIGTWYTLQRCE